MSYQGKGLTADLVAYNRAYGMKMRANRKAGIIKGKCACSNLATYCRGSEYICQRCIDLEDQSIQEEIRRRSHRSDNAIKRNISAAWMAKQTVDWVWSHFTSAVDDLGNEFVVHGHGEYHLAIGGTV